MTNKSKNSKKKSEKIIRSTSHRIHDLNHDKRCILENFSVEYRKIVILCIEYLWNNKIEYLENSKKKIWDRKNDILNCPSRISTVNIPNVNDGMLSARVIKCAATQACGMVKAVITERIALQEKLAFAIKYKFKHNKIDEKLKKTFSIPEVPEELPMELNSIVNDLQKKNTSKGNDGHLRLKYLNRGLTKAEKDAGIAKQFPSIIIPFKFTKVDNKFLNDNFKQLNSFLVSVNNIDIRYSKDISYNSNVDTVGIDTGINSAITLSTGVQSKKNNHGKDLQSIIFKKTRKIPGSKAFRRVNDEMENYINWAVKQLNLRQFNTIFFEEIRGMKYKTKNSKMISAWLPTLIERSILNQAELHGVRAIPQKSYYRSQRCNSCGWTHRKNRVGIKFVCTSCKHADNADINAAKNHNDSLPAIYSKWKENKRGFFWKEDGFVFPWKELAVPSVQKSLSI